MPKSWHNQFKLSLLKLNNIDRNIDEIQWQQYVIYESLYLGDNLYSKFYLFYPNLVLNNKFNFMY